MMVFVNNVGRLFTLLLIMFALFAVTANVYTEEAYAA
jgi:hypothetical protein